MLAKLLIVCLLAFIHSIDSALAPYIKKCNLSDSKCITNSAREVLPKFAAGIPDINVEALEPLKLDHLDASSPNLKLELNALTAKGLSQCTVKNIAFDQKTSKISVNLLCTVDITGKYKIDGNIIFLRLEGDGNAHVILSKIDIIVTATLAVKKGKDGLDHWSVKSYEHTYTLKDKATIELDNLFGGNEALGRAAKELFKSSPNEIVTEVGPPIIKVVVEKIVKTVNSFFKKVPLSELIVQ